MPQCIRNITNQLLLTIYIMSDIYIAYSIISITQESDKGLTKNLAFHQDGFSGLSSTRFGKLCDILGLALITHIFNNLCI